MADFFSRFVVSATAGVKIAVRPFDWRYPIPELEGTYATIDHCATDARADSGDDLDGDDFGEFEERGWCDTCGNTGSLNCFCGGDLCVCENNGEYPCPDCG